jgi:tetratricopeptide (TPR) repeat protein
MAAVRKPIVLSIALAIVWLCGDAGEAAAFRPEVPQRSPEARIQVVAKKKKKRRRKQRKRRKRRRPAGDPATAAAKKHYQQGESFFALGEYHKALEEYSAGYKQKTLPAFLFNIAQCHWNIGDAARAASKWDQAIESYDRAIFFYRKYLAEARDELRKESIEEITVKLEAAKAETEELKRQALEAERARKLALAEEARRRQEEAAAQKAQAAALLEQTRLAKLKEEEPVYKKWWFWTIIGVVVASGSGAAVYFLSGDSGPSIPTGSLGPGVLDCRNPPCSF